MNKNNVSFKQILSVECAFYNQTDYVEITRKEMASSKPLNKPTYTYNTENRVLRIAKDIFSVFIFPIGLYKLIHSFAGKLILPASLHSEFADQSRKSLNLSSSWKVKRISVEVDGYMIDAAIMGKASTLGNGRWVLSSNGNGEFYENKLEDHSFRSILSKLKGNAIVFNYPGVGSSSGMPNRNAMAKAYRAMLNFLEDQEKGIGAKEIIGYGHSIGGGVQGEALRLHELKQGVNYVFVKSRTFSDLSIAVSQLTNRLFGLLIKVFGWNMNSLESSKKLKAPEIIMQTVQTADESNYTDISLQSNQIIDDGVISPEASLAKKLLEDKQSPENKYFMGIPDAHNVPLRDPNPLVNKINEMLNNQ